MIAAHMCMGVRPSTGILRIYQQTNKEACFSLPQQLPVASNSIVKCGAWRSSAPSVWLVQCREHDCHDPSGLSQLLPTLQLWHPSHIPELGRGWPFRAEHLVSCQLFGHLIVSASAAAHCLEKCLWQRLGAAQVCTRSSLFKFSKYFWRSVSFKGSYAQY